jgi:plastocyanin
VSPRVTISNFSFEPKDLTVPPGTEVEWLDEGGRHSIEADDGSFKSDALTAGASFKRRFDQPGIYKYFCSFHGSAGGHDMAGTIVVKR